MNAETPEHSFDLFAGKKLMDMGLTAEALSELSGDIFKKPEQELAPEVIARARVINEIKVTETNPKRVERLDRGFLSRKEERDAKKRLKASVRRYHRLTNGPRTAELKARAMKTRKARNKAVRQLVALQEAHNGTV